MEHVGFIEMMSVACPVFKIMSRNTIRSDMFKMYKERKEDAMQLMEKNSNEIAVTTVVWAANNQKRGYITGHFIDESWVLRSQILSFQRLPSPHNAPTLTNALIDCLMDWNVDHKLSTLTEDNCSTNDVMIPLVKEKFSGGSLLLDGKLSHMCRCAHFLNLIVKDGTPKRMETFEGVACQLKIHSTRKIALDCPTRWNSTYAMLSVAIIYKDCFPRLKQCDSKSVSSDSEDDWTLATDLEEKLHLFYQLTRLFSGTKYPTPNLFFPKNCEIKLSIRNWLASNDPYFKDRIGVKSNKHLKH